MSTIGKLLGFLSVWIHIAITKVVPYNQDKLTVYSQDSIQINMTELFDLSKAGLDTKFSTDTGRIVTNETRYALTSLDHFSFSKINFVHFINNLTYVAIFDDSQVLIRQTSMDGKDIVNQVQHSFKIAGANAKCTDIETNSDFSLFYLVCFAKSEQGKPGVIYVSEFKSSTGELIKTVSQELTADFEAVHNTKILLTKVRQSSHTKEILIVYDQGLSATNTTKNFWLGVFEGPEDGETLAFIGFANLRDSIKGITSFFDAFHYDQGIVISAFVGSVPQVISALDCELNASPLAMNCGNPLPTLIKQGYVGLINTGQFIMVDLSSSRPSMKLCDIGGEFEKETWTSCKSYLDIEMIADAFVTEVVGNPDVLLVKYDHPDGSYAGFTVYTTQVNIDPKIPAEWTNTDLNVHATVLDKRIHHVTAKLAWINWMTRPALELDSIQATVVSDKIITVTATEQGTNTNANLPIMVISSFFDSISYNVSKLAPVSAYEETSFETWLIPSSIEGNGLDFTVNFDGNDTSKFAAFVADTKNIGVLFKTKTGTLNFKDITFFADSAVSLDTANNLVYYVCNQSQSLVYCDEKGNKFITEGQVLQKRMFKVLSYVIAWTQDSNNNRTIIHIFDKYGQCFSHPMDSLPFDIVVTELELQAYILASYPDQHKIEHWRIYPYNPGTLEKLPDITQSNSSVDNFCPSKLYFCPNGANVLEVLTACPNIPDRRMLKYTYWPQKYNFMLRNFIPINLNLTDGQFCPMGGEFIISSIEKNTLFGVPTYWENAYYDFGIGELNLGKFVKIDCVPTLAMFSLVTKDDKGNLQLTVFMGNSQYAATSRARFSEKTGLEGVQDVTNHNFMGNMIHVNQMKDGSFRYMMTYHVPKIDVKVLATEKPFNTTMFVTASNAKNQMHISVPVEIVKFDSSIKVEVKSKVAIKEPGVYNLEEHMKIEGVFTKVTIEGANQTEIEVLPRIHPYKQYEPSSSNSYTFKHIEASENFQLALHSDNPNSAIFTLFKDVDTFLYNFAAFPGIGVKSFHFAVVDGSKPESPSLLVAFCTEGLETDRLDLLLVSNGTISSIGYTFYECSSARVLKRDNENHFYVVTHDGPDSDLNVFNVTLNNQAISVNLLESWNSVYTWGVAETKNAAYVIMILNHDLFDPFIASYEKGSNAPKLAKKVSQDLGFWRSKHYIFAIECISLDDEQFTCIYDTYSTKIYEVTTKESDINATTVSSYTKVPGFDGREIFMTKTYFGVLASNDNYEFWDILIYKRRAAGGSGDMYTQVGMESHAPFTLVDLKNGTTVVSYCTKEDRHPLKFAAISTLRLDVKKVSALSRKINLKFGNLQADKSFEVSQVFTSGSEDKKSLAVWPFILVLLVLVGAGLAYLAYVNHKQRKEEDLYKTGDIENKVSIGDRENN